MSDGIADSVVTMLEMMLLFSFLAKSLTVHLRQDSETGGN